MRLEQPPCRGKRNRTGDELPARPKRDVHCPVVTPRLTELPCAVQRIDNPDSVAGEPPPIVDRVLYQHGIVRTQVGEGSEDQHGRSLVALVPPNGRRSTSQFFAEGDEKFASAPRQVASERVVGENGC